VLGDDAEPRPQQADYAAAVSAAFRPREAEDEPQVVLAEAGTDKSHVLAATVYLADMGTFNEMNAVWDAWVTPGCAPARATVGAPLASSAYRVEIVVTAARP